MKKIVLASNNKHKIKEFKKILKDYEILSLNDIGFKDDIVEDGNSFSENAIIKSKAVHNYLKSRELDYPVISDDSGLCVVSLNNEPGIYSARYAKEHDDEANRKKVLDRLKGKKREAFFVCVICLYYDEDNYKIYEGKTYGTITEEEIGNKDFGYDCIFYSDELNKTFGEASEEEKNSVSHRGRAIEELLKDL